MKWKQIIKEFSFVKSGSRQSCATLHIPKVRDRILVMSQQFWSYQTILTSCSSIKTGVSGFVNIIMESGKETDNFKQLNSDHLHSKLSSWPSPPPRTGCSRCSPCSQTTAGRSFLKISMKIYYRVVLLISNTCFSHGYAKPKISHKIS
jgi:hypothetical protein